MADGGQITSEVQAFRAIVLILAAIVAIGGCAADDISSLEPTHSVTSTVEPSPDGEGSTRTTVTLAPVRLVSPAEWAVAHANCLEQRGFAVTITPDGGVLYPILPSAQQPALEGAIEECNQLYPIDTTYQAPLDRGQLETLYAWYVNVSIPCLESTGYSGFSPPALEVFIDTYYSEPWTPYGDIETELRRLAESEWYSLQEECPQAPPLDELFER